MTGGDVGSGSMGTVLRERRVEVGNAVPVSITADGGVGMNERMAVGKSMTFMTEPWGSCCTTKLAAYEW